MPHSVYSDINSTLWDLIGFGRGGRRGSSQKTAYIRGGLQQGFLSNSYPFILDESELGRANFRKPAIQKEYEAQHPSAASPSQSVRPRLEENPKTFNLASAPGAGGTCLLWTPTSEFVFRSVDHLVLRGVTRASKFLFIDWHQVFNRSRTGDAHLFRRAPRECVDTVVKTVQLGETLNKSLFVAILSYVDTDRRVSEVIEILNATDCSFSFVLITRRDRGNEGKAGVLRDFIRQLDLDNKQILLSTIKLGTLKSADSSLWTFRRFTWNWDGNHLLQVIVQWVTLRTHLRPLKSGYVRIELCAVKGKRGLTLEGWENLCIAQPTEQWRI